jgi:hypothetical protein
LIPSSSTFSAATRPSTATCKSRCKAQNNPPLPLGEGRGEGARTEDGAETAPAGAGNRFKDSWLAGLPVPLPKNYLLGIDLQKSDFEDYHGPSYLRGEFRNKGWWYYYLYALAIKAPLGTWVLFLLACGVGLLRSRLAPGGRIPTTRCRRWKPRLARCLPVDRMLDQRFIKGNLQNVEHVV